MYVALTDNHLLLLLLLLLLHMLAVGTDDNIFDTNGHTGLINCQQMAMLSS